MSKECLAKNLYTIFATTLVLFIITAVLLVLSLIANSPNKEGVFILFILMTMAYIVLPIITRGIKIKCLKCNTCK